MSELQDSGFEDNSQQSRIVVKPTLLGQKQLLRHTLFELIGTAFLAFGICSTAYQPPLDRKVICQFHDVFISLSLYVSICFFAPFSPTHFNPSVSLGFAFRPEKTIGIKKLLIFIIIQISGAIVGAGLAYLIYDIELGPYPYNGQIYNPTSWTVISHTIGELIGTFFFVFFIMMVTCQTTSFVTEESWIHFVIPLSLYCARTFSHHIGGINPAVVIATQVIKEFSPNAGGFTCLIDSIIISIGSLLGGVLASFFFARVYLRSVKTWRNQ